MENNRKGDVSQLPLLPLRGVTVFPGTVVTLDVGREKSIGAVEYAMAHDRRIFVTAQIDAGVDVPQQEDLNDIGVIASIKQIMPLPDQTLRIMVKGEIRAVLYSVAPQGTYVSASCIEQNIDFEKQMPSVEDKASMRVIVSMAKKVAAARGTSMKEALQAFEAENMPGSLCDMVANSLIEDQRDKQHILETFDIKLRLEAVLNALGAELSLKQLEEKIQQKVHDAMERANHEYYLREEIRAIQNELSEDDDEEIAELRKKLSASAMPDEAREKVEKELHRLSRTAAQSPEAGVSQNYIEYMLDLPWGKKEDSRIDISKAQKVLDEDHFGLKDVKERLVEYLAVKKVTDSLKSPIICLVGPPGVGKTSIAKSIARALDRKFTQVSLGGVHDEAEVRGHRKTYVGAMPGRIITSIQRCGSMNPVFLLDEIDKIARDMRGDPAAALLEALDPEQNRNFRDHYVEAPFDLSDVLFITTANSTEPIDHALLDRMEVIEVNSYTPQEKLQIAKHYLFPKQMKEHGLKKSQLRITDKVIDSVIDGYTREAGVRNLERIVGKICRKAVLALEKDESRKSVNVNASAVRDMLGPAHYMRQDVEGRKTVGLVNGLAWTSVGGEVMPVETVAISGKGAVEITGKLGDVMQESVRVAKTLVRLRAEKFNLASDYFEKHDLHLHVPEGAVPKDGPSAGAVITCSILSAVTGIPARNDIAMTGEITLHGKILPIGGVREKLLAAYRMGIMNILMPKENEKDLEDVDAEIMNQMDIRFIENVDEAIAIILETK